MPLRDVMDAGIADEAIQGDFDISGIGDDPRLIKSRQVEGQSQSLDFLPMSAKQSNGRIPQANLPLKRRRPGRRTSMVEVILLPMAPTRVSPPSSPATSERLNVFQNMLSWHLGCLRSCNCFTEQATLPTQFDGGVSIFQTDFNFSNPIADPYRAMAKISREA